MSDSDKPAPEAPDTKGHEPPAVTPRAEGGDVAAGHEPPVQLRETHEALEERGHQAPADHIELGHPPAEGIIIVQQTGEMHSPAEAAPPPTAAPPKPADSAQSVTPPPAAEPSSPPAGNGEND